MSATTNLDLGVYRIASQEAISIETRLAVLALRRAQAETSIMNRLAQVARAEAPASNSIAIDKTA